MEEAEKYRCDVILCNHPRLDGYKKIEYAKERCAHMPNVYVIGEKELKRFCGIYRNMCYERLLELDHENEYDLLSQQSL